MAIRDGPRARWGAAERHRDHVGPVPAAREGHEYIDIHAWVFTPASFRALIELAVTFGLADFAIAYEHEGDLTKAKKAYLKALDLDPDNPQIRQNYELFKEIDDRAKPAAK